MRVPVEVVVDRMINAAFVFPAIADIQRCYAEMVEKRAVIRAGAESTYANVRTLANFLSIFSTGSARDPGEPHTLRGGQFRFGILNVGSYAIDEMFQCVRSLHLEISAAVTIAVDIH